MLLCFAHFLVRCSAQIPSYIIKGKQLEAPSSQFSLYSAAMWISEVTIFRRVWIIFTIWNKISILAVVRCIKMFYARKIPQSRIHSNALFIDERYYMRVRSIFALCLGSPFSTHINLIFSSCHNLSNVCQSELPKICPYEQFSLLNSNTTRILNLTLHQIVEYLFQRAVHFRGENICGHWQCQSSIWTLPKTMGIGH